MTPVIVLFLTTLVYASASPTLTNSGRIVGGGDIPIEDVPYQVSLQSNGSHDCGGSIIAPNYIVTAAHCTYEADPKDLSIRAGTSTRESGGQVINVKTVYNHPDFNENTIDCDIAVLELAENLEYNDKVAPIPLAEADQSWPAGTKVLVSGWGLLSMEDTSLPVNLQGVTVELVDQDTCQDDYGGSITSRMLCAGVDGGGKDSCSSDSGGPLQIDGVLVGVVSFGNGCALPNYPGVYASVSALRDFIDDVTESD